MENPAHCSLYLNWVNFVFFTQSRKARKGKTGKILGVLCAFARDFFLLPVYPG